jgi:hypothetical protein
MSSKRGQDLPEEKPAKRQRRGAALKQDSGAAVVPFDSLNNDCLVHILSFLENDEMNDATLINGRFCKARNADSLDQTRSATIVIKTEDMDIRRLLHTISHKGWTRFFAEDSKYKRGKIVGIQRLQISGETRKIQELFEQNLRGLLFQSVTSLDVSQRTGESRLYGGAIAFSAVTLMFPNLQEVDLSFVNAATSVIRDITNHNPNLRCIKYNGADGVYFGPAFLTPQHIGNLFELQLDDSSIVGSGYHRLDYRATLYSDLSETETYLFMQCHSLERVTMKNASWKLTYHSKAIPVPQDILIKLVRHHPTLRWFRSDLTDESIAMLKQERPEVTLVNK